MITIKVRRVDWYADEWLAGTAMLDAAERGVYVTICSLIYSKGGSITRDKKLAAICGCHGNAFNRIIARLSAAGKIIEKDSEISVKRCEKELEKARIRLGNSKENGQKGGRPPNKNNKIAKPAGSADEKLTRASFNHQPTTIEDSEANASAVETSSPADPVKDLWDRGLKLLINAGVQATKARPLIGKWRREFGDAAVMAAIAAAETEVASEPIGFLSACLANSRAANGVNGLGRKTAATERFERGRQATLDACLRIEKRNREREARDGTTDFSRT